MALVCMYSQGLEMISTEVVSAAMITWSVVATFRGHWLQVSWLWPALQAGNPETRSIQFDH